MHSRTLIALLAFVLPAVSGLRAAEDDPAQRVIILANSAADDSVALARYYAQRRGVPAENIIAFPLSKEEIISRTEYQTTLGQPLQDELVKRHWIDGLATDESDALGRKRYVMLGHRISYLVICRGVPLRIEHDPAQPVDLHPPLLNQALRTNGAAVDSELALLAQSGFPLTGFVSNPLFHNASPMRLTEGQVVKVSRLDGPTGADARRLVDQAMAAESTGLIGRAYIDLGGPHPQGDGWLAEAGKKLEALGFETDTDHKPETMTAEARFDAPAVYFGWYIGDLNGPFKREGFRFPPGAIALHIYSYSAWTLHSATAGWVGPLIARGVTATFGNVNEPYLQFTLQPQLLVEALSRGWSLGDAAAYAQPVYSWMTVVVGDPLYRPFRVPIEDQWRNRAALPAESRAYVLVRQMRLLTAAGQGAEAIRLGREAQQTGASLPVALTLAELEAATGDRAGARQSLEELLNPGAFTAAEAPLAVAGARQLEALGEQKAALEVWDKLLDRSRLTREDRVVWLPLGLATARSAKDLRLISHWEADLEVLDSARPGK